MANSSLAALELTRYSYLNRFVSRGQILFFGSTYTEHFPIYELKQDFEIDKTIYNRGICGLTLSQAFECLDTCVFQLEPSKLFLNIGEEDLSQTDFSLKDFAASYQNLISTIRRRLPKTEIYLISVYPQQDTLLSAAVNESLWKLAAQNDCDFLDMTPYLTDSKGQFRSNCYGENMALLPAAYAEIFRRIRSYFYSQNLSFGDVWGMINSYK